MLTEVFFVLVEGKKKKRKLPERQNKKRAGGSAQQNIPINRDNGENWKDFLKVINYKIIP